MKNATASLDEFKPYVLETPIRLDTTYKTNKAAEIMSYLPIVESRVASQHHPLRRAKTLTEVSDFPEFARTVAPHQ